jgi:hypothetical protein
LIDKIKLVLNKKGDIVLISSSLTVMIQYNMMKEEHEESFDMNSDGKDDYFYNDG